MGHFGHNFRTRVKFVIYHFEADSLRNLSFLMGEGEKMSSCPYFRPINEGNTFVSILKWREKIKSSPNFSTKSVVNVLDFSCQIEGQVLQSISCFTTKSIMTSFGNNN